MARRAIFFAWVASAAAIALQTAGLGLQEHASVVSRFPPVLEVHELLPALKNNTAPRWLLNDEDGEVFTTIRSLRSLEGVPVAARARTGWL